MSIGQVVPTADGVETVLTIPGGTAAGALVLVSVIGAPPAGSVTVDYRAPGSTAYQPLAKATNAALAAGGAEIRIDGPVGAVRIKFTGVTAPGFGSANVWVVDQQHPARLFDGFAAMVTQPYTEANVKNGVQFYGRAVWNTAEAIPSGATRKLWFRTGAKPVIVKLRDLQYVCEELVIRLFRAPVGVSGGTDLAIHNYNGINPVATTVQAKKNVTTTGDGVEFDGGDPETLFGAQGTAQRSAASIPQGRERVLPANTEFLVTFANLGTGPARVQYFLDWYEGASDLPL